MSDKRMASGSTILIVDDDPAARLVMKALLAREGFELAFAESGAEALEKVSELMPDLVLLDVMMPHMDGFEVCRHLRSNPLTAQVPIIMVTALADRDSRLRGVEAGADDFISKPFDAAELKARVQTIIHLNRFRLLRERARFEQLIQSLPDGIAIVDSEGVIRLANPAMHRLLGASEELVGQNFFSFVEPGYAASCSACVLQAIAGESVPSPLEVWLTCRDTPEGRLPAEVRAVPFIWEGKPAAQVTIREITLRKRAEEALRRYAEEQAALYTVASATTRVLDPDAVLSAALDAVLSVLHSEIGWVMLPDPDLNAPPRIAAWRNLPPDFVALESTIPLSSCPICTAIFARGAAPPAPALVKACPRLPPAIRPAPGAASHVAIPLCTGNEVLGVMEVLWRQLPLYSEQELMLLLMTIGQQVGLALRNAQLYREARQVDRLRVLNELDRALAATLDVRKVAELALRHLASALDISAGMIVLPPATEEHRNDVFTLHHGWVELEDRASQFSALFTRLRECHSALPITAAELAELVGERWGEHNLLVPIRVEGKDTNVGLLILGRPQARPFTDEDQVLLQAAAGRIALAIQSASLYHASLAHSMRLATLNAISSAAVSSLELDTVLRQILALIAQGLNAEAASILINDPEGKGLVFALSLTPALASLRGCRLSPGQGIAGWVAQHGQPVCVNDVRADPRWYEGVDAIVGFQTRSLLCAPLKHHEQIIGVIEVINKRQGDFTTSDLSLLEAASSIIAAALENARLYMRTKAHAAELALLNEVGLALTSTLDFTAVAYVALSQIQRRFSAELVALLQPDSTGELRFIRALSRGKEVSIPIRLEAGEIIGGWAIQHRQPVLIEDVQREPRFVDRIYRYLEIQARSAMAVPLVTREHVVGAIEVIADEPGIYAKEDLDTLQAIASTLAVALENASLYEELRRLLREREHIQAQLFHAEKMTALGRLAASITHEINNPLQAVQTYLALAEEELVGAPQWGNLSRYLSIVGSEIERISHIVGRLRDFYRPAREGMKPTYLHAVLESVLDLTQRQLQHAHISVERKWAEFLPEIQANPDHLKQVFLNLVLNAIDAMPQGGVLRITTATDRIQSFPAVRVEFSDTGAGMPPEVLAHLFEPFFTTKEQGTGLGLSISYDIIQAHNGRITVHSQPGEGTTYTILLPLEQPHSS
ncbi:MAG: GAF domain-containing protein [Anaerolineae bacterium]|nr:GAF domain-containing protein [Anaerolineae bacterium]